MQAELFTSQIEDSIHPGIYPMKNSAQTELDSLYWSKKAFFTRARYAYASLTLHNKSVIEAKDYARAEVTRLIHARRIIGEVGLYLVIIGSEDLWLEEAENVKADSTGFHATIIQAIHFVDLDTGATTLNQSKWGSVIFGKKNLPYIIESKLANRIKTNKMENKSQ